MQQILRKYYHYITLFTVFVILVIWMQYYYPNPNISWDTDYYIKHARTGNPGLRPAGYSIFLSMLHKIVQSLKLVVAVQYTLYFFSLLALLAVLQKIMAFNKGWFITIGVLMLAEPTGLYHCIAIYSDLLFSTFTYLYLATLLYFVHTRKWYVLLVHSIVIFACLETRFISLYYPFFSILVALTMIRGLILKILCVLLFIGVFKFSYQRYVDMNRKTFGVAIHSAFSGWTHANNVMYALPRIHLNPKNIRAPHLKYIHSVMSRHVDSSDYVEIPISSDYIWDGRSPLNRLCTEIADSMRNAGAIVHDYADMFLLAPRLEEYGLYIQKHYPYEYIMGYMVPNIKTMILPHDGEMGDFYVHQNLSDSSKMQYHLKSEDMVCRRDIFKERINAINAKVYPYRLLLFAGVVLMFLGLNRLIPAEERKAILVSIMFVCSFMLMMLYSSWFMYRYILPTLPVMTALTVIGIRILIQNRKHLRF